MPILAFDFGQVGTANAAYAPDQGADWNFVAAYLDANGKPIDMTGYRALLQIRAAHSAAATLYDSIATYDVIPPGTSAAVDTVSGSTTITLASGSFSSASAGNGIQIPGAGVNSATLNTSIVSASGTTAVLAVAPSASLTGATATWGPATITLDSASTNTVSSLSGSALVIPGTGTQFSSADVGKAIFIPGAGAAGTVGLSTTIADVLSATEVTLAAAASGSATGSATWGGRVTIKVPAARTTRWSRGSGFYGLILTDASGNNIPMMSGAFYVLPGATYLP